jgi:hypothetical protein
MRECDARIFLVEHSKKSTQHQACPFYFSEKCECEVLSRIGREERVGNEDYIATPDGRNSYSVSRGACFVYIQDKLFDARRVGGEHRADT